MALESYKIEIFLIFDIRCGMKFRPISVENLRLFSKKSEIKSTFSISKILQL